jgi:hypothetical protein
VVEVPTFSPTISIPPAVAGATESPVVEVPTFSPTISIPPAVAGDTESPVVEVPTFSPTISIPPAVAGDTESPVVDVLFPTISPSRASVSNPPITTDSELATLNDGCPPGEVYLGVNLSIEISFRLSTPSITLDEILAAPFSQQVYRETYRLDFLKEDDPLGVFTDLTCTSELLFEAPTQSPTFYPSDAPTLNPICELRPYEVSEPFQNWV